MTSKLNTTPVQNLYNQPTILTAATTSDYNVNIFKGFNLIIIYFIINSTILIYFILNLYQIIINI